MSRARWVDVNKGSTESQAKGDRSDIFAAMPPLELIRKVVGRRKESAEDHVN